MVTDGPFAESKEVILGFDILECDSIDEAVEIAAKHPMARAGPDRGAGVLAVRGVVGHQSAAPYIQGGGVLCLTSSISDRSMATALAAS